MKRVGWFALFVLAGAMFFLMQPVAAHAAGLRVRNDTDHDVMVYCIYERSWDSGEGHEGNWGGWRQLGEVERHGTRNFYRLRHGRWRVVAQTRRGRVFGPRVLFIRGDRDDMTFMRIRGDWDHRRDEHRDGDHRRDGYQGDGYQGDGYGNGDHWDHWDH